jgi:exonuclease SbcC
MVRLRRLTLKDFISHRHTTICFDDSAYVIIGENASGKTSILRGIFFSLFGKDFTVDKLEKLIRRNTSSMLTELTFLHRGTEFTVKRRYFLSRRKAEAELFKEGSLYASGVRDVSRVISEELGLEPNIFRNTIYVPQGEIMALLSMQRKERRQILNKFLGLDEMGRKHEETKLFLCVGNNCL